jgi:hypothetical protein
MSEILCRIDPEEMNTAWINSPPNMGRREFLSDYLTAHAVPEAPVLFGGVEEVAEFVQEQTGFIKEDCKEIAKLLLSRFGIPWDKAPEWATRFEGLYTGKSDDGVDREEWALVIPRPALSLEERRERGKKLLETADDELLKRLGV